jgi:hypothetical protein
MRLNTQNQIKKKNIKSQSISLDIIESTNHLH